MANELPRPDEFPAPLKQEAAAGPDREARQSDPDTWYGLVWRIVRAALESDANLIRVSVLIILVCAVLWLAAKVR